jgi:ribosomal protein S18 acetylase RimI-like enzyme
MTIDLIAVQPDARKNHLGAACIQYAASYFQQYNRISVGTQAANIKSLRFYARLGFQPMASKYVLHFTRV